MPIINFMVVFGEIAIGTALILGLATRFAGMAGVLMMALFYVANWSFATGPFNEQFFYGAIAAVLVYTGAGEHYGIDEIVERLSFYPAAQCLGLVMPSNSPAVNSLWLPAIPLKIPVLLKPGRDEPWTPYRLIQALIASGCPAEAFGFYPTDHEGSAEILRSCGRALVFGDRATTAPTADKTVTSALCSGVTSSSATAYSATATAPTRPSAGP
jgi:hypothetical protein